MNKFMNWLEKVFNPLASAIAGNKYLIAIRDGFLLSVPLLIAGSFFLLIANFPIPAWIEFMNSIFGETWSDYMAIPASASFDVMALLAVGGIAYSLAKQFEEDAMQAALVAIVVFFVVTPFITQFIPDGSTETYDVTSIPIAWMGSKGMFLGMITSLLSTRAFVYFVKRGWTIKMPESVPLTVIKSFEALIPAFIVIAIAFVIRIGMTFTPYGDLQQFIFVVLQTPLTGLGNTLGAMVVAYLFLHFFWFFGINGSSVVGAVFNPILKTLAFENLEAFKAGDPIPNIINQQFQDMFATLGGAGSTLSLIVLMIIICKSERIKKLSRLSIVPGVFGINEPIIFGLPIVLNPLILIPFMLVPTVNIIISYFAMDWGWVPLCNGIQLPWTTPPIISGFLVSGWQGAVLQVILFFIGMVLYYPFIKILDNKYIEEEKAIAAKNAEEVDLDNIDYSELF